MGIQFLIFMLLPLLLLSPKFTFSIPFPDPELIVQEVNEKINASRRNLGFLSCGTGNPIDDCWGTGRDMVIRLKQEVMVGSTGQYSTNVIIHGVNIHECKPGTACPYSPSPTAGTASNNYLTHHNKVMLLGHSDSYKQDKKMQDTFTWSTRIGKCTQSPTINSQGNRFLAPDTDHSKERNKVGIVRENERPYLNYSTAIEN
ncbi:probable pectate lyase 5 isoform X2 [Salvia hispanica]|uniref:probable pectate lyase 5 isoform X2 n=1 Tax=Salvia hispanica TaxID=49212 RepID=UPI0020091039|nr:probable pectate lyase 5 isoform X2 [Salvia hispanica]